MAIGAPIKAGSVIKTVKQDGKVLYSDQLPDSALTPMKQFEMKSYGVGPAVKSSLKDHPKDDMYTPKETKSSNETPGTKSFDASPEEGAIRKQECLRSKQSLANLSSGRVVRFREDGERYFLNEIQVNMEKTKISADITKHCD